MAVFATPMTQVAQFAGALFNLKLGSVTMNSVIAPGVEINSLLNSVYQNAFANTSTDDVAAMMVENLGITDGADVATQFVSDQLAAVSVDMRGEKAAEIVSLFSGLTEDATFGAAATAWNAQIQDAVAYAQNNANDTSADAGTIFNLEAATAAGADVMKLTGDQDVRIDMTNSDNQITGLDLNGNGVIDRDGVENNQSGIAADFEIVDAYARNPLNISDSDNNFLGNIYYDGTGVDGDGVSTDGNIFLGGLGADTAFGGIGNDFLAGGGAVSGSDYLSGGRNADFFFAGLSLLSPMDGDNLFIDGGNTTDDTAVGGDTNQDSDWLLIEAADDDEPVTINLSNEEAQTVATRSGVDISMDEIENVDASGNLYGFLDDMDTVIGEMAGQMTHTPGEENTAIGTTAQMSITGSDNTNILIGGFDNDVINGEDGDDLIFGGRLDYNNNPNSTGIMNDGVDTLIGGAGEDNIAFETDGGTYEGASQIDVNDNEFDTLWLTELTFGTQTAADVTTDGVVRIDLGAGKQNGIDNYAGFGGADQGGTASDYTADQTNYANGMNFAQVQDFEGVIATGLGAVDYLAAGTNDPELGFNNQQNIGAIDANLDLRGTTGDNTLYAAAGDDVIEGREGDDMLSGGEGTDDFIFDLSAAGNNGDGLDIIHRQTDIGDNLTDGTFGRDFGLGSAQDPDNTYLYIDITASDIAAANKQLDTVSIDLGGVTFEVTEGADLAALEAATNADEVAAVIATVFAGEADVTVTSAGNVITIMDATGREFTNFDVQGTVVGGGESFTNPVVTTELIEGASAEDRLLFVAYQDRADNERVDDDAMFGGDSLGADNYAQDLVVGFDQDGSTVIAEDQSFTVNLENLAVEDAVTVSVNGVQFSLTVGKNLNGDLIPGETTGAFAVRLAAYINAFLDDDTAAGKVAAANLNNAGNTGSFTLTQADYANEETVFMAVSVDVDDNSSLGEGATATVTNNTATEVTLFKFDGRDNALNADNVLFLGDTGISRSVLETAADAGGNLFGSDAIVVNVDDGNAINSSAAEGVNASEIFFNTTENLTTGAPDNYAVHGDDQLIGGNGDDVVQAGTGDDRVYGSFGEDTIDGGKDLYLVDGVVRVLNDYEATQVDALPTTISIEQINQVEFDDTLIYQQSDFGVVGQGGSKFEITLDLSADQANGGAGKVVVDGDEAANRTLFTNMENIRTVSGDGTLAGQGNDTLDLRVSVNPLTGAEVANAADMTYDLTSNPTAGQVTLDGNLISKVDGVENVLFGSGDDVLNIDETEAGKNNLVDGGLGDDTVNYSFDINSNPVNTFNPAVTMTVNSAADTDTIAMTGGLVGNDMPMDTLVSVENVIFSDTLHNPSLDDTLDVTNVTGAVVDFVNGQVRDGSGKVQVNIGNMQDFEVVNADPNDTVIVSDAMANSRLSITEEDVAFESFLNYDLVDGSNNRETIADMRANNEVNNTIPQAENIGLYTFNMGSDTDADTVDYSNEAGLVAAVANFDEASSITVNNVMVSHDNNTNFADNGNRVDAITSTENLVASAGESIIDLTQATGGLKVRFNADDGATASDAALDRDVFRIQLSELDSTQPITGMNFLSYEDAGNDAGVTQVTAEWNTIEGSDNDIMVELTDHETTSDHTFNLRGGDNEVNYNELTRSIETLIDVTGTAGAANHMIEVENTFTDGNGVTIGGTDIITNYTAQNAIAAGTLRIEASQDAEDSIEFAAGLEKLFLLGETVNGSDQITVTLGSAANANSMVLTGYEFLNDASSNDVYDMADLDRVVNNLTLSDNGADDHDTLKVLNDAVGYAGAAANTINLEELNDTDFSFDFDVLDITGVTNTGLTIIGDTDGVDGGNTDELLTDNLANINGIQAFEAIVLNEDVVAAGTNIVLDLDANKIQQGSTTVTIDAALTTLSIGGISLEGATPDAATVATTGANITVTDVGAVGATIIGGNGNDVITGGAGADTFTGGAGADTMDGNFVPEVLEVHTYTLSADAATPNGTLTINGVTITEGAATQGIIVADNDADAYGAAFVREWDAAPTSFTANASIESVTYDALTNALTFTFTSAAGNVADTALGAPGGTIAAVAGPETVLTQYAAQGDSADTFIYLANTDSQEGAMDIIENFNIGAVDDVLDLSAAITAGGGDYKVYVENTMVADFAAAQVAANAQMGIDAEVFVVSDNTDAWVFVDYADSNAYEAGTDMVIKLVGVTSADLATMDANNFFGETNVTII